MGRMVRAVCRGQFGDEAVTSSEQDVVVGALVRQHRSFHGGTYTQTIEVNQQRWPRDDSKNGGCRQDGMFKSCRTRA